MDNRDLSIELSSIIEYCCFPYPEKRGHPKAVLQGKNQFDFHRIVTKFDILSKKAKLSL
jgi:hypothetical protein